MQEVKVVVLTLTRARMGVVVETQKPGDGKTYPKQGTRLHLSEVNTCAVRTCEPVFD